VPFYLLGTFHFFAQFTKFLREGMPPCLIFEGYAPPPTLKLIYQSSTTVPLFLGLFVKELQNAVVCSICLFVHT